MSNLKLIGFYLLPLVLWISLIYIASSMSYESQNVRPLLRDYPTAWVENWFSWVSFTYGSSVISLETRSTEAFIEFFIRKGAHVFIFAVLAVLFFRLFQLLIKKMTISFLLSMILVSLFALFDEYRHMLHPNRSGMIEDVILDVIGAFIGLVIYIIIIKIIKR